MWSLRPRFSWITSTAPRGSSAAAQAPRRVRPCGPGKVTSWVATAGVGGVAASPAPVVVDETGSPSPPQAASSAEAAGTPSPSRARRRSASRREYSPSAWSIATSSARYRWNAIAASLGARGVSTHHGQLFVHGKRWLGVLQATSGGALSSTGMNGILRSGRALAGLTAVVMVLGACGDAADRSVPAPPSSTRPAPEPAPAPADAAVRLTEYPVP